MAVGREVVGEHSAAESPGREPGKAELAARGDEEGREASGRNGPADAGELGDHGLTTTKARAV